MSQITIDIPVELDGPLGTLSRAELHALLDVSQSGLYAKFRRCALAVLNTGNDSDDTREILRRHENFEVSLHKRQGGLEMTLTNPPAQAFVDGVIIQGIRELLHAVLRDILFAQQEIYDNPRFDLAEPRSVTSAVFQVLRNAGVLRSEAAPSLVVCWGGHAIDRAEYEYTKQLGYQLGLRGMDICTGCGPGAMKGPMKGAAIGHAKQRIRTGRYIGISEPAIIAAESPNPIVNQLVIMPDIEKRLEAFVRLGHGFVLFPGGAGTAEEFLYLLGILLHPDNEDIPVPVVLTGPPESAGYLKGLDRFVAATLGAKAQRRYRIVVGDAEAAARHMREALAGADAHRAKNDDAPYFHWKLRIDPRYQQPFEPTHPAMAALRLTRSTSPHELAASLRCAFSGIVSANIKDVGIRAVEENGPFELHGDGAILGPLGLLLEDFIAEARMTLREGTYAPPYRLLPTVSRGSHPAPAPG